MSFTPVSARALLEDFKKQPLPKGTLLPFTGAEGFDVYNPSVPFSFMGRTVIAARVQRRDGCASEARLFARQPDGSFALMPDAPRFIGMEDPFVTVVAGKTLLGGTEAEWTDSGGLIGYRAAFYRLNGLGAPELLFRGPERMKDIRLTELPDGRIAVFTRPQGEAMRPYRRTAAIGMFLSNSLLEITAEKIATAPLFQWHFLPDEWGGVNALYPLPDGKIGAVGHIARGEGGTLHYYSTAQVIDPERRTMSPLRVIACRDCWPDAPAREPRLRDVCFTAGLIRRTDGTADLYTGLSDAACGVMRMPDPF